MKFIIGINIYLIAWNIPADIPIINANKKDKANVINTLSKLASKSL